ncbi:MAG: hypothetical protein LAT77_05690 [Aliidiomarina sp.]|uniref:WD40/YVTN/BNR-like repeat-containing protein n=1 Tax=Aliidiomarina sp. TaxID=1872439 RepID=UPI0025B83293|nr:hypothetical protein [Aliidiomarina sp.]MCH8501390.1 hypothetical protein [Aliidiomarina sp.]
MKKTMVQVTLYSVAYLSFAASGTAVQAEELATAPWQKVYSVDGQVLWLGSSDGRVAVSSDGGDTWRHSHPGGRTSDISLSQVIAFDERHAFTLSSGRGERSRLYVTRNGGFSWRRLYRGNGDEVLRCFDLIPDGEGWVLGDTLLDNWHVVRSSNGNNWLSSRSGFAERALFAEQGSDSGQCVRYANNIWAMGTRNADTARLIYKTRTALRFQVADTPLSAGTDAGIETVYPLAQNDILIAGGRQGESSTAELFRYQAGEFTELNLPATNQPIRQLFAFGDTLIVANADGVFSSPDMGASWTTLKDQGVLSLSCTTASDCWAITQSHQPVRISF